MRLQQDKRVEKIMAVNADAFFIVRKRDSEPPFEGLPEIFGNFRNEYDQEIDEFYGLNSRCYSMKLQNGDCITKCVGFDLTYQDCNLNFESFRQILLDKMVGYETKLGVRQRRKRGNTMTTSDFNFSSDIAKKRKIEISENDIISHPWGFKV